MRKLCKTINDIWKISEIGSMFIGMISVSALGIFFLCFEEQFSDNEFLDTISGFFIGFSVMSMMIPYFMVSAIIRDHKLTMSLPVEAAKLPQVISLTIDISVGVIFIIDSAFLVVSGNALKLTVYTCATLFVAIMVHIGICGFSSISMMNNAADEGDAPKNVLKVIVYMIFLLVAFVAKVMVVSSEIERFESRMVQIVFAIILAVMLVLFAVIRVATGRELRSRMRLEKVYKKRKTKEPKEESYV